MRVAYVYLMGAEDDRIRAVAPDHAGYWRGVKLSGYMADRSAIGRAGSSLTMSAPYALRADARAGPPKRPLRWRCAAPSSHAGPDTKRMLSRAANTNVGQY